MSQDVLIGMLGQWWDGFVLTHGMMPYSSIPWDVPLGLESLHISACSKGKACCFWLRLINVASLNVISNILLVKGDMTCELTATGH